MKIAILGAGLVGGSIGFALKNRVPDAHVVMFDRDPAVGDQAAARGACDAAVATVTEAVEGADLVIVATPVGAIAQVIRDIRHRLKPGCILTDVGSTKSRLVREVEITLPSTVRFIGGHPMAGSEDAGIEAAKADLFEGAWWILTPTERSDAAAYQQLHALFQRLGARIMALDPDEHDELLAVISHLPQLVATTLMNQAAERGQEHGGLLALAAGGFRDVTRVAASNPEIWVDICSENQEAIAEALESFEERLASLRAAIAAGDTEGLRSSLLSAREARRSLPGKGEVGDLFDVRIPVPDRPGVLAHVTTLVGNLGVNIEDLGLSHSLEGGRGSIHLAIAGESNTGRVVAALQDAGYEAKATLQ